ncbi:hypothetical protein WJX77_007017 [Trebouxia sp. C0004]
MATCEYEVLRQQRIADNRKRMDQLGLQKMSQVLVETSKVRRAPAKPRVAAARNAASADLIAIPARRSTRAQGKPAPNYNESALDLADRVISRKGRKPFLGEVRATSVQEQYTQEDIALLGDYKEPWELFVDGTDATGKRVYDKLNGMTCHQCRQKTLGKHTICSCCNSLQGVLCGDCLFMRYGENILEVAEKDEWTCPVCRGLCNCSNHRIRRGWAPTGSMYRRAIAEGYRSVAHYLVLTQQASDATATKQEVNQEAGTCTAEPGTAAQSAEPPVLESNNAESSGVTASVQVEEEATKPVKIRHSQQQTVQQTLVSLLAQSKTGQAAVAAKLNPKKRSRDDVPAKAVGLASTLRRTRSRAVVGV